MITALDPKESGLIPGFSRQRLAGADDVQIDALVGGAGPPVLLLHGFPESRLAWKHVAPSLAQHFTIVAPDLRGYGRSDKPLSTGGAGYSKRVMAADQVRVMQQLGFERFAVVGHDRGGRVAYRMALDSPTAVTHLAILDIMPTLEMWRIMDARFGVAAFHWPFLAQPAPFPERLIGGDPTFFFDWMLSMGAAPGFSFDAQSRADYLACLCDPAATHAICEDYRAGWLIDRAHDEADLGRSRIEVPVLVLWGDHSGLSKFDLLGIWSRWADDVRGHAWQGGHFGPEENPAAIAAALEEFLLAPPALTR